MVWKSVNDFISVSNQGDVKSHGKLIAGEICKNGYRRIHVSHKRIDYKFLVHRLVAEAFIPNPLNLPVVNHIDGNKQNNCVENLEWCTCSENGKHAYKMGLHKPKRKLHDVEIDEILENKGKVSCIKLARMYGVSFQWICKIWKVGGRP